MHSFYRWIFRTAVLASLLFLASCTLSFKLKSLVYSEMVRKMEKTHEVEGKALWGELPAQALYQTALKKYHRLENLKEISQNESEAFFELDKIEATSSFLSSFRNYLKEQIDANPQKPLDAVLADFVQKHPEPWPRRKLHIKVKLEKDNMGQWSLKDEQVLSQEDLL